MNGIATPKKKLSGAAIVSMLFGILFAIAAACMVLLPLSSANSQNTFEWSVIGNQGSDFLKQWSEQIAPNLDKTEEPFKTCYIFYLIEVIAATAAFFGVIGSAVFILLGKALNFKKGGRVLALIFSIIGLLCSGFMLAWTIIYLAKGNEVFGGQAGFVSVNIGIGPILMASFSFLCFIFCCIAVGDKSAFKKVSTPNPYDPNSYYAPQNNVPPAPQPVQPQNMGYVNANQPFAPQVPQPPVPQPSVTQPPMPQPVVTQPPVSQPMPIQQPVQPFTSQPSTLHIQQRQPEEDQPTIAQNGAIEGVSGDYAGTVINLKPGEKILIGRDAASCNIVLSSERKDISRKHCSVKYDPYTDSFKVIDMSSNGTYVNGRQLVKDQETQFPVGTVLALGNGENQFRLKKV